MTRERIEIGTELAAVADRNVDDVADACGCVAPTAFASTARTAAAILRDGDSPFASIHATGS